MKGWECDFQGPALSTLVARIKWQQHEIWMAEFEGRDNLEKAHAQPEKIVDIVQSQGMGKSRLVSELAKQAMMITSPQARRDRLPTCGHGGF